MQRINDDIRKGQFQRVYLLSGEEAYLLQDGKKRLLSALNPDGDTMNFTRFAGKNLDVRELISLAETLPFFAEYRTILVEDSGFFKNKCDELADYIPRLPDYLRLVFVESEVDKRGKLYKAVKSAGYCADYASMTEEKLIQWGAAFFKREGRGIRRPDMEKLIGRTGTDMSLLRMEMEKLIAYTMGRDFITAQDIDAVCTERIENRIFDMIRAVSEQNQKQALALYYDLLALKEPPMRILFLLTRQFRQMLEARKLREEGHPQPEICTRLGVPSFALRNLLQNGAAYTESELVQALEDFAGAEEAVKTGRLEDVLSVELLIVQYSTKKKRGRQMG